MPKFFHIKRGPHELDICEDCKMGLDTIISEGGEICFDCGAMSDIKPETPPETPMPPMVPRKLFIVQEDGDQTTACEACIDDDQQVITEITNDSCDECGYTDVPILPTTGPISRKPYECSICKNKTISNTNHWGKIYPFCPTCKNVTVHNCLEEIPSGYAKPPEWKLVRLGSIAEARRGKIISTPDSTES